MLNEPSAPKHPQRVKRPSAIACKRVVVDRCQQRQAANTSFLASLQNLVKRNTRDAAPSLLFGLKVVEATLLGVTSDLRPNFKFLIELRLKIYRSQLRQLPIQGQRTKISTQWIGQGIQSITSYENLVLVPCYGLML